MVEGVDPHLCKERKGWRPASYRRRNELWANSGGTHPSKTAKGGATESVVWKG
jgi:hypothetical protein